MCGLLLIYYNAFWVCQWGPRNKAVWVRLWGPKADNIKLDKLGHDMSRLVSRELLGKNNNNGLLKGWQRISPLLIKINI